MLEGDKGQENRQQKLALSNHILKTHLRVTSGVGISDFWVKGRRERAFSASQLTS